MMLDVASPRDTIDADLDLVASPPLLSRKPVLIILHMPQASPGHVGHWFQRNGYPLDIRRHFAGDPLPTTLADHCGAVIFGGSQSANDDFDYMKREIDWIGVALKENKPYLGVCLGAQMLARHLGAKVGHCRASQVEIGYHRVQGIDQGRVLGALPDHVYQWHREGFELPHGADLLAVSDGTFRNQAFRYGPSAFGVQFHPEITHVQINRWSGSNPVRLLMRGARSRPDQLAGHLVHAPRVHAWLDQFLTRWVDGRLGA